MRRTVYQNFGRISVNALKRIDRQALVDILYGDCYWRNHARWLAI